MERIIFFDGICSLCNTFIDFVVRHDQKHDFKIASLQSATAREKLPPQDLSAESVVFSDAGKLYRKSDAALRIMFHFGGLWQITAVALAAVPRPLRDFIYGLIARNRYRFFGKRTTCRLPTAEEKTYFLE